MDKTACKEIVGKFIEKLKQVGQYEIELRSWKPQICIINGKAINIRCTIPPKLWYSIDLSVFPNVDCTLYFTRSPLHDHNYFLIFPFRFLNEIMEKYEMISTDTNNQCLKHFFIDCEYKEWCYTDRKGWEHEGEYKLVRCMMKLKNGLKVDVMKYAYDLDHPECYPDFKKC